MLNLLTLKPTAFPFLQNLTATGQLRAPVTSLALGHVIAQYLPLGDANVQIPENLFREVAYPLLDEFLGSLRSIAPIDHEAVKVQAERFYLLRRRIAFGCCKSINTGPNGVYNILHVGTFFDPEELDVLNKCYDQFQSRTVDFEEIFLDFQQKYAAYVASQFQG